MGALAAQLEITGLTLAAAAAWIRRPVSTEPVKAMRVDIPGWATSPAPITSPVPCTTLTTPGGMPASTQSCAMRTAAMGVCSAGLSTMEFPQARAAATKAEDDGRSVPRHDEADHADRLAHDVDGDIARDGGDAAADLGRPSGEVVDAVDRDRRR